MHRYSSTSTELLYGVLPKVFGTPNYFSHSAIRVEAEKMGFRLSQGSLPTPSCHSAC